MIDDTCRYCNKESCHTSLVPNHDETLSFVCYACLEDHVKYQKALKRKLQIGDKEQIEALKKQRGDL